MSVRLAKGNTLSGYLPFEHVFCLSGKIEVQCLEPDAVMELCPGDKVGIQPLRQHRITNYTDAESKYLLVQRGTYDFIHRDP